MSLFGRNTRMTIRYEDDLRLFRTHTARVVALVALGAAIVLPLTLGDFWLSVLCYAGIATIGATGLNLLVGYTGQVSLGHAFFLGTGAYVAAFAGGKLGLPLPLWLAAAALIGAAIGALIGPFALRLRGNYLVIVSLGLLIVGQHVFENWDASHGWAHRSLGPRACRTWAARLRRAWHKHSAPNAQRRLFLSHLDRRRFATSCGEEHCAYEAGARPTGDPRP